MKLEGTHINQIDFLLVMAMHLPPKKTTRGVCAAGACRVVVYSFFFGGGVDNIRLRDEWDPPRSITNEGAREQGAPAKDPPNSHTPPYKHTQKHTYTPSIQAYIQNKTKAKHTKPSRHSTTTPHPKQHPKQHPKNRTAKKSITLYNSKYCIR